MENLGIMVVMEADKSNGSISWLGEQESAGQMGLWKTVGQSYFETAY